MAKKKKGKAKGRSGKTSHFKLANKRTTKLAKQGKLKKRKRKIPPSNTENKATSSNVNTYDEDEDSSVDDSDVEYFSSKAEDISFVSNIQDSLLSANEEINKRKRKRETIEESEEHYEKLPRKLSAKDRNQNLKMLLPIKTKDGIVMRSMVERNAIDASDEQGEVKSQLPETVDTKNEITEPLPELNSIQLFALRQQKLAERKRMIALLASSVIENPEQNIKKLKELRLMLDESDPDVFLTVRKLVMVSLKEIFKDIIPGYRIRLPTKEEKQQKLKKETKILNTYEESFLTNYRFYLEFLERTVKGSNKAVTNNKSFQKKLESLREIPAKAISSYQVIGMQCLCELLISHPHFNYRNNIITVIVPFMNKHLHKLSDIVCDTVKTVFREDRAGEVSLEIVRCISRMIKARDSNVQPKVLDTFLSLRINKMDLSSDEEKKDEQKKKENRQKLSKRERKRKKHMAALEHELLETKATADKKKLQKLYTEITQAIFLIYFRILKNSSKSDLLPAVLEGLAKFAHLINVDFFDDLFQAFSELIESGNLSYRESLHCVQTSFTILSGQGSALNIDPMRFYTHLYAALFRVHIGCSSEDIPILLNCLDVMVSKRKRQVSQQRVLSFIKRLCSLSLLQRSNSSLALLAVVRNLILTYKYAGLLFDNEAQGSGVYLPELMEPEHCNAHNTMLWELALLKYVREQEHCNAQNTMLWELALLKRHYSPVVKKYNNHISRMAPTSGEGQLHPDLSRRSPIDLYTEHNMSDKIFPEHLSEKAEVKKKKKVYSKDFVQVGFNSEILGIISCIPDSIDRIKHIPSSSVT